MDPQQRIAELEQQLAQQKRIAELERQLVEAKGVGRPTRAVEQPTAVSGWRRPAGWIGPVIAMLGGAIGLCVGGAAAVTAVIPSTALWMSPIVCRGGYAMAYNTSHYSYKPGQSGTSVSFQCVGDGDYYDVNDFAVFALQSLLVAVVLCVALAVIRLLRRRSHKPA